MLEIHNYNLVHKKDENDHLPPKIGHRKSWWLSAGGLVLPPGTMSGHGKVRGHPRRGIPNMKITFIYSLILQCDLNSHTNLHLKSMISWPVLQMSWCATCRAWEHPIGSQRQAHLPLQAHRWTELCVQRHHFKVNTCRKPTGQCH